MASTSNTNISTTSNSNTNTNTTSTANNTNPNNATISTTPPSLHDLLTPITLSLSSSHSLTSRLRVVKNYIDTNDRMLLESRKSLIARTKEFRGWEREEQMNGMNGILKSYQEEIDRLIKYIKYVESEISGIDGNDMNSNMIDEKEVGNIINNITNISNNYNTIVINNKKQIDDLNMQINHLKIVNNDLELEFKNLKNQEITVRRLEDENKNMNIKYETKLSNSIEIIKNEILNTYESKLKNLNDKEIELKEKYDILNNNYNILSQNYIELSSKQLDNEQKNDNTNNIIIDDIMNELQAANETILTLKHKQIEPVIIKEVVIEQDINLKNQLNKVLDDNNIIQSKYNNLESLLNLLNKKLESYELEVSELSQRPTIEQYDELNRALKILEIANMDATEDGYTHITSAEKILLIERRKLRDSNISLNNASIEKDSIIAKYEVEILSLYNKLNEKMQNIKELEESLQGKNIQPPNVQNTTPLEELLSKTPQTNEQSFDSVLISQRDRLKQSLFAVETEKSFLEQRLNDKISENVQLTSDNVSLTEKVRYLSNLSGQPLNLGSSELKYIKIVDENNNPFQKFQQNVTAMQTSSMNSADRLTLSASSFVLGKPSLRMLLFGYAILLHFLIFASFYYSTSKITKFK